MYKIITAIVVGGIVAIMGGKLLMASDYVIGDDGNAFIDEAFPGMQKQYDRELASGEEIRLGQYSGTVFITTKILNKKFDKVTTKTSQSESKKEDHRYNKNDYVGMNINGHIMDKKQIYWRARIQYWCDQYQIDCKTPLAIAFAESRYRPEAKHGCKWYSKKQKNVCSTAGGLFQFVDATWKSSSKKYLGVVAQKYDGEKNIQVALQKIKNEGTGAWNASKSKWLK